MSRFLKFAGVGAISTSIDFILYMFIGNFVHIALAKFISISIASIFSFIINKHWTFHDSHRTDWKYATRYIISQLGNITVNVSTNYIVFSITKSRLFAFICATGLAMIVNFFLQKTFVFIHKEKS